MAKTGNKWKTTAIGDGASMFCNMSLRLNKY
jgi:hypothetical protein